MAKKIDKHHLLFPRHGWSSGYARALRNHWYFAAEIPRETLHAQIHQEVTHIPVPKGALLKDAYEQIIILDSYGALHKSDSIEKKLRLLLALFDCACPEMAEAINAQLDIVHRFNHKGSV